MNRSSQVLTPKPSNSPVSPSATNATLAFLGGGSLATGGAGMATGAAALNFVTIGPAILVSGFVVVVKLIILD